MDRQINTMDYLKEENIIPDIKQYELHPEEVGRSKMNSAVTDICSSIDRVDKKIKSMASEIGLVLEKNINRLDSVMRTIHSEKERLQDIAMLCNMKTDYNNVIPLDDSELSGNYTYRDGMFSCSPSSSVRVVPLIENITGNGYEGNQYVLLNNQYLKESLPTNNRASIVDNSENTFWEYSRITASKSEESLLSAFNTDSTEAKCTITFNFQEECNELLLTSDLNSVRVTNARYSNDNLEYKDLGIMPFKINDKEESYTSQGYVYGNNVLAFPPCKYLKVTFESSSYLDETLAFDKTIEINEELVVSTNIVSSAKRHVIRLNKVEAYKNIYNLTGTITSNELIGENKDDIYAISIFSNIYLPQSSELNNITFTLTVNGEDIEVIPLNNHGSGTKIIRFSQGKLGSEYTKYIGEKITSAFLNIAIKGNGRITPYLNNLKILLGGEV